MTSSKKACGCVRYLASCKTYHPKGNDLNTGNITQALISASSLQVKKDTRPIVIDYDTTNRN